MSQGRISASPEFLLRILLALLVLGAGIGKALDIRGFVGVIRTYELWWFPQSALFPVATFVTAFEISLGAWLLTGRRLGVAALLSAAMHIGYFVLLVSALLRGLRLENCGCFGVFLPRPLTWLSPVEDLVLVLVSLGLYGSAGPARTAQKPAFGSVPSN